MSYPWLAPQIPTWISLCTFLAPSLFLGSSVEVVSFLLLSFLSPVKLNFARVKVLWIFESLLSTAAIREKGGKGSHGHPELHTGSRDHTHVYNFELC